MRGGDYGALHCRRLVSGTDSGPGGAGGARGSGGGALGGARGARGSQGGQEARARRLPKRLSAVHSQETPTGALPSQVTFFFFSLECIAATTIFHYLIFFHAIVKIIYIALYT